jgi:hypothetical protein
MHAIVVGSAAMIGCYIAAKVALILNVGLLVFFTVGDTELVIGILTEKAALGTLKIPRVVVQVETSTGVPSSKEPACSRLLLLLLSLKILNVGIVATLL